MAESQVHDRRLSITGVQFDHDDRIRPGVECCRLTGLPDVDGEETAQLRTVTALSFLRRSFSSGARL